MEKQKPNEFSLREISITQEEEKKDQSEERCQFYFLYIYFLKGLNLIHSEVVVGWK